MKAEPNVFTGLAPAAEKRLAAFGRPLFSFALRPKGLRPLVNLNKPGRPDNSDKTPPPMPPELDGKAYTLLCGTGNPDQVRETAASFLGRAPERAIILPDHHRYTRADVERAVQSGDPVLCTAKDAVKLAALLPAFGKTPVWVLEVAVAFGPALFANLDFDAWWREEWQRLSR
jgi:tetraacyldisaccharide 4'-kinase